MVGLVVVVMVDVDFGLWVWVLGVVANGSLGFWMGWLIFFLIFWWWLCGFIGLDRWVWCFGCGD